MKPVRRSPFLLALLLMAGLPACGGRRAGEAEALLLYCGAGLRPPVAEAAACFERTRGVRLAVDYAGAEVLLSKLKLSRKGDLYLPGDRHYVDQAEQAGFVLHRAPVCRFEPVILVQKGNPKGIRGIEDLVRPGIRLGLGDERACAIGRKARAIFEKNGVSWDAVEQRTAFRSLTVNELGMQIQARALDAVIVWRATARYYEKYGDVVEIPREKNVISFVEGAVLSFTCNRTAAEAFLDFLCSGEGRRIFKQHGYRTDLPR